MEITKKELGNLVFELTMKLETSDYKPQFDQEIKKYRNKAHLKGFRKGKTPVSALKKMYGKGLLAELLNKKISEELEQYIKKEDLKLLGEPLPSQNLEDPMLDVYNFGPLEFGFKIGLAPEFDIVGLEDSDVYESYEVKIDAKLVDEEFENIRKRFGNEIEVDKAVESEDYINLKVNELDQENIVMEDGIESEFGILINRMSEDYQSKFIGKRKGDECVINILNLEKDVDRNFVTKYFLKVDEKKQFNELFVASIQGVRDLEPAEVNEELFKKAFAQNEIKTQEEAKVNIRKELEGYYKTQGGALTERYILESLVQKNDMDLPHDFLKEWLVATNDKVKLEDIDTEYEGFVKNLKWSLIKQNAGKKFEIDVQQEEIKESMIEKMKKMMQTYNYPGLDYEGMIQNMLQQPDKVREEFEEVYARKVFDQIMQSVTLKLKKIDIEDYKDRVKKLQDQN